MDDNNRNFILAIVLSIGRAVRLAVFLRAEDAAGAAGQASSTQPAEPGPPQPQGVRTSHPQAGRRNQAPPRAAT